VEALETMSRKKKGQVRARKVKSSGVWIAPDLERKIKGEGGRRGLSEPPYSYYLYLADLVLKSSEPVSQSPPTSRSTHLPADPLFTIEGFTERIRTGSSSIESDSIPLEQLPVAVPPKPPKVTIPKPPKAPVKPKPAKRVPIKPLQRPAPQKLPFPKPPKRRR
jgi:hypothetical protein